MFLGAILQNGLIVQVGPHEFFHRLVVREKVGSVDREVSFVGLLIEIDGADAILHFLEVGGDVHDVVYGAHITKETEETALTKFHEFLGNPHIVEGGIHEVVTDEDITGYSRNVFLNESVSIDEVVDAVGRKGVLELETKEAGGIGMLYVVIIGVSVEEVRDADSEGARVAKFAEVDAFYREVLRHREVAADF